MAGSSPPLKVILRAAGLALAIGLAVAFVLAPPSSSPLVRAIELLAVIALGILVLAAVLALVTGWLGGWQDGEAEFELVVRRAERLAGDDLAAEPDEGEFSSSTRCATRTSRSWFATRSTSSRTCSRTRWRTSRS